MMNARGLVTCGAILLALARSPPSFAAETFSVATYNLENYLDEPTGHRQPKSEAARAKIRESFRAMRPDVVALQEMGNTNELLEQEAIVLREIIDTRLRTNPNVNLIVLGDFNDLKDSRSVRTVIGRGKNTLIDTRPAERDGEDPNALNGHGAPRNITWTYYFAKEDTYSRIDYILLNHGMAREWQTNGTYVLALPDWGAASDHRPIMASFVAEDR